MFRQRRASADKRVITNTDILKKFLEFLASDYWKIPLETFIEQQSILFENGVFEENVAMSVRTEYITMVDCLIDAFCDDLHITLKALVTSLEELNKSVPMGLQEQLLLEPVIAAQECDDVFKNMMIRKNYEIRLQTMHFLELMEGNVPNVLSADIEFEAEVKRIFCNTAENERLILISIMKQSHDEFEAEKKRRTKYERDIEEAIKASLETQFKMVDGESLKNMTLNDTPVNDIDIQTVKARRKSVDVGTAVKAKVEKKISKPTKVEDRNTLPPPGEDKYMYRGLLKTPEGMSPEKIKEREAYLIQQRDKLIELKRKERAQKLEKYENESTSRPKTASAAKKALNGRLQKTNNDHNLEARKAIVNKLKEQVVDKAK
uniref:Cilia- and flagella-associated protein 36 n=1 Tax=Rhabditophanes sp. KR3021 TaxID=114890 RepID=A0AC35TK89_9BILA